jgi:hypothetical protein
MAANRLCAALLLAACVVPALTSPSLHARAQKPSSSRAGLNLLHKLQDALGGASRIAAVKDYEETIRAEAWDSAGGALGEFWKRTRWMRTRNVLRLDQRGRRGTYVLYLDGDTGSGWEIPPDVAGPDPFKTTGTPVELTGGELQFANGYLSGFELNLWLADRLPGYRVTNPKPNILRIEHGGNATDFTLDPSNALPLSSTNVSLADPSHPVPAEMRYDDWKQIEGVQFATHRVNYHSGLKRGEVFTEAINVNVGLEPARLAAKPVDGAPDIPGSRSRDR